MYTDRRKISVLQLCQITILLYLIQYLWIFILTKKLVIDCKKFSEKKLINNTPLIKIDLILTMMIMNQNCFVENAG